jgi:hypothetical protein
MSRCHWCDLFHKDVKSVTLQGGLEFDISLPRITRVTDMQVRHNISARHNQLPAKPPYRQ